MSAKNLFTKSIFSTQNHWLERIVLPWLGVGFCFSLVHLLLGFANLFVPQWAAGTNLPVLSFFLLVEGVFLSNLLVKARVPFTLRVLEFGLVLASCYWILQIDRTLTLTSPEFLVPTGIVVFGWMVAAELGGAFATIGSIRDTLGDQAVTTLSWEQESMMSPHRVGASRASVVDTFARRLLFFLLAISLLGAITVEAYPHRLAVVSHWQRSVLTGVLSLLFFGLALQSSVFLYRLRTIWQETNTTVSPRLVRGWFINTLWFVLCVTLIVGVLPTGFSPLRLVTVMESVANVFDNLLHFGEPGRTTNGSPSTPPVDRRIRDEAAEMSWLAAVLLALYWIALITILGGLALSVIGLLLVTFFQSEREKFRGILRLPVLVYFWVRDTMEQLLTAIRSGAGLLVRSGRTKQVASSLNWNARKTDAADDPLPSEAALFIRQLLVRLAREASRQGCSPKRGQTPSEYLDHLAKTIESLSSDDAGEFSRHYARARFSHHPVSEATKDQALRTYQQMISAIKE